MGLGSYRQTAHEVEVVEMLEICSMLEQMAEVNLVGMIPADIESVDIDLTEPMKRNFDAFIATVIKEIESTGVTATLKDNAASLEAVIDSYANPTAER